MREERIFIDAGGIRLEGLYAAVPGGRGAVVCHPHSLLGGTMENPVVETTVEILFRAGYATLRFNFRGVGRSGGAFDEGRGEQEDLLAAAAFLEAQGIGEVLPAGYSFGAWVIAGALPRRALSPALFAAPPLALFPFDLPALRGKVGLICCGDEDPYCPLQDARAMAAAISSPIEVLPGADHFFGGGLVGLATALEGRLAARSDRGRSPSR